MSKDTALPVQPLATANSDQQNIAIFASFPAATLLHRPAMKSQFLDRVDYAAHSLSPLALICIRLI